MYPSGGFLLTLEGNAPGIPVPSWDHRCFLQTGRLRGSSPIMGSRRRGKFKVTITSVKSL